MSGELAVWQEQAACKDQNLTIKQLDAVFFPDGENLEAARRAEQAFCGWCPVRSACLTYAVQFAPFGLWAGTTPAQRRALGRKRDRVKCPTCQTLDPVEIVGIAEVVMIVTQFCRNCGASWIESTVAVELVPDDTDALDAAL